MSSPQYGPDRVQHRLGDDDAVQRAERDAKQTRARAERDAEQTTARAERDAAAAATRAAREQESDAYSEQAHHWRPNRLPHP
jgi:hypothetical protein